MGSCFLYGVELGGGDGVVCVGEGVRWGFGVEEGLLIEGGGWMRGRIKSWTWGREGGEEEEEGMKKRAMARADADADADENEDAKMKAKQCRSTGGWSGYTGSGTHELAICDAIRQKGKGSWDWHWN